MRGALVKRHNESFNDGILNYGYKKTQRSDSGKRVGNIFTESGKLAFRELSARDSDYQSCGMMGAQLDKKVKTLYPPSFRTISKSKLKVVINQSEYDVIKVDSDSYYLYFYLQEVGDSVE